MYHIGNSCVCVTDSGGDIADLDAILGELCELETAIDTTRTQINTSLKEACTPGNPTHQAKPPPPELEAENHDDSFEALDLQLQNALSELSDIAGGALDLGPSRDSGCESGSRSSGLVNGHALCDSGVEDGLAPDCKPKKLPKSLPQQRTDGRLSDPGNRCLDKMHDIRDLSPDTNDVDSAFSDSASLPSSGSHVSVTTTSSQHSGSSANSGASGGTGSTGMNGSSSNVSNMICAFLSTTPPTPLLPPLFTWPVYTLTCVKLSYHQIQLWAKNSCKNLKACGGNRKRLACICRWWC